MPKQNRSRRAEEHLSESEDDFSDSDVENVNEANRPVHEVDEKDSDEEELERLVLGNKAAFRANLFKHDDLLEDGKFLEELELEDAHLVNEAGIEEVDDSSLFFLDTAPQATGETQIVKSKTALAERTDDGNAPAWIDSDDERLSISLASVSRLRKLRETAADDVVSGTEYARRLRQQYLRLNPLPDWAREPERQKAKRRRRSSAASAASSASESEGASDDEGDFSAFPLEKFLRDANSFNGSGARKRRKLRPEVIDIQRTRDIPDKHKGSVDSLSFHPQYPVLLSSSPASVLFLHHIAPTAHPTPNPQLTSVQVKGIDVRTSEFLRPSGEDIIFAGRRRYFHSWNLSSGVVTKVTQIYGHKLEHKTMEHFRLSPDGRHMAIRSSSRKGGGMLNVINAVTMQWVAQARLDSRGGIADFAWWRDGEGLTILGRDGHVAEWSMETRRTLGVWRDEGSVGGTVMTLGGSGGPDALGGDRWIALGSTSGVLNIYDRNELLVAVAAGGQGGPAVEVKALPEPARRFEQLVTLVTAVAISPDGQLLAFGSRHKADAFRLAHLPSCTVYRNWPTQQTPLGRVTAVAFDAGSEVLAVGNDVGKIRLWEIRS
ncbi:Small nucleolar ribonucleoprotein complex subunit [Pleurostoma richardsiae]|uniref:Small nucleolar ribonucleoprotein complex subunit n=1 Tax=Pleurostoma richardsiae TaxID=41990 RepID=A0AA38RA34_9PEZI|nr:Small nucleolar ribonucleoprotein complex subunit [Pleurostoma richardsiae]